MNVPNQFAAVNYPHLSLVESHQPGVTEPWVAEAVCAILKGLGGYPTVLESGGFLGITSSWLALTLQRMGAGDLTVCEIEMDRAMAIEKRLSQLDLPDVKWGVVQGDVLQYIQSLPNHSLDFVWLDDDHQKHHVEAEICALWDKMRPGGIIAMHDVFGSCDLQTLCRKYGGTSLDFPKLGPAGGLGLISIPR